MRPSSRSRLIVRSERTTEAILRSYDRTPVAAGLAIAQMDRGSYCRAGRRCRRAALSGHDAHGAVLRLDDRVAPDRRLARRLLLGRGPATRAGAATGRL